MDKMTSVGLVKVQCPYNKYSKDMLNKLIILEYLLHVDLI